MQVTDAQWASQDKTLIIVKTQTGELLYVPADESNLDYQQLINEKVIIAPPAVIVDSTAKTAHAAWFRLALIEIGKFDAVEKAVLAKGMQAVTLWNYATSLSDQDTEVVAIAKALGIDLADLFARAEAIRIKTRGS